ncbi:hypothetical protein LIPSTDRAFT_7453 [Lipomyces starkeyi NRRL Y-11557]|uniref:Uncharacterized protein n=1 Tax=Lipomyces starkeyi NRRL Y-11557 TaxID=675824 RepID=A0A1E3PV86_LIPST|nr:hypothetical protein LIPSTDRAFT_7453 [Lipomyces starkeyi NRRL Y-11557]
MNLGTDSEGDSDEGLPSRSRRRLDESQRSAVSQDIITPGESASQVFENDVITDAAVADDGESFLSSSPITRNKPIPPKAWMWEDFHTAELETTYLHRATKKKSSR